MIIGTLSYMPEDIVHLPLYAGLLYRPDTYVYEIYQEELRRGTLRGITE